MTTNKVLTRLTFFLVKCEKFVMVTDKLQQMMEVKVNSVILLPNMFDWTISKLRKFENLTV